MRMIELQNKTDNGLLVANQQRRGGNAGDTPTQ